MIKKNFKLNFKETKGTYIFTVTGANVVNLATPVKGRADKIERF